MQPGRITVVDSNALGALTRPQLRDAIDATSPDVLVATSPGARVQLRSTLSTPDLPIVTPGNESAGTGDAPAQPTVHALGDVQFVVADSTATLHALPYLEADGPLDPATESYVLTDALDLSIRPTELRTVRDGLEAYRGAIEAGERRADRPLQGSYTHLSTALPAGYYGEWKGLTVRGVAPGQLDGAPGGGTSGADQGVVGLELGPGGTVAATEYRRDSLGLRAIDGIGEQRARTLREAGYEARPTLADADVATIADLDGLPRSTAARLVERAGAFEDGRVLREADGRLPDPEPIFVDVETDGLSPSIVWLIGVLDREAPPGDRYRSFLARDPDDPAVALEAFCSWHAAHAADRPIVAYNGDAFDVPVLAEQIERHCPEYSEQWTDAWTFDPYDWAVREDNAVLPGRTNRLEDVADALGFEADVSEADEGAGGEAGVPLSGAEVARIYRSWMADPAPANEPDWASLQAYCEADVRALAHVYDAIEAADRSVGEQLNRNVAAETTQGSLGDF